MVRKKHARELVAPLLEKAESAARQGNKRQAVAYYRRCLDVDPRNGVVRNNLGCLLLELSRDEEAVEVLAAERLTGAPKELPLNFGFALLRTGKLRAAERILRMVLDREPASEQARNLLGMALMQAEQAQAAQLEFRRVLRDNPQSAAAWNNLGCAHRSGGDLEEAREAFDAALREDPYNSDAHNNLGCALRDQGALDEALEEFGVAAELDPRNPAIHLNLAKCYKNLNQPAKALWHLRQHLRWGIEGAASEEVHALLYALEASARDDEDAR
ncbi:MAG: tetratricopeptide repeat protein [Planctomycetes bacterium]|nr:tetratricopeptide repeat protein [Planctomycetota bacterium]